MPSASSYTTRWLNSSRPSNEVSRGRRPADGAWGCTPGGGGGLIIPRRGAGGGIIIPEEVLAGLGRTGTPFGARGGGTDDIRGGGPGLGVGEFLIGGLFILASLTW